jgi:hypothetical protein
MGFKFGEWDPLKKEKVRSVSPSFLSDPQTKKIAEKPIRKETSEGRMDASEQDCEILQSQKQVLAVQEGKR